MVRRILLGAAALLALVALACGALLWVHYRWPAEPQRVVFESGGVELVGALIAPEGDGPHPAILLLPGSEPATRDRLIFRLYANLFVPRGFAVLAYDKRGCGESGGDFETAELPDLAADARAAVRYLRARPDVRAGAIGLMGGSQSGWFTPEVAVREPGVAFVINRSAPTLRYDENVAFEIASDLRAEGVEEEAIGELVALWRRSWSYYGRAAVDPEYALGPERQSLEAALAEARARHGENFRLELPAYDPELYARWAGSLFYDPRPWLERLEVPLLAVYGETDINVPAARSAAVLDELAAADPRREFTVVVLDGVGHQLQSWRAPHRIGFLYLDEMVEFARAAVTGR